MKIVPNRTILFALVAQIACAGQPSSNGNDEGNDTVPAIEICSEGKSFENCSDGWCRIEPGSFTLGSPLDEPCRGMYSEDQVEVTLTRPFLIRQHELTQVEWEARGFPNPSRDLAPDKPVVFINWFEAAAYCNALSQAKGLEQCYDLSKCEGTIGTGCFNEYEGCVPGSNPDGFPEIFQCTGELHRFTDWFACSGYRLPTSAEWEYAARAGSMTSTYNGEITTDYNSCQLDEVAEPIAWYCANSGTNDTDRKLAQVCRKQPNAWGVFDSLGNASEWIDYIYTGFDLEWGEGKDGPLVDPLGADIQKDDGRRSVKGGSFLDQACLCRVAEHMGYPAVARLLVSGFRPVRTLFE
jgi:formylglycine-generating enzyme required for sulfatase activity